MSQLGVSTPGCTLRLVRVLWAMVTCLYDEFSKLLKMYNNSVLWRFQISILQSRRVVQNRPVLALCILLTDWMLQIATASV